MFFLITIFLTALVSALFGLLPGKLQRRSVIKQDIVWAVGLWLATWLFAVFAYHRPGLTIGFNAFRLVAVTALNGGTGFVTAGLRSFGRKGLKAVVPLLLVTALGLEVFVGNVAYFNTHSYEPFQLVDYLDENINVGRGLGTISLDEDRTYLRFLNIDRPIYNLRFDGLVNDDTDLLHADSAVTFTIEGTDAANTQLAGRPAGPAHPHHQPGSDRQCQYDDADRRRVQLHLRAVSGGADVQRHHGERPAGAGFLDSAFYRGIFGVAGCLWPAPGQRVMAPPLAGGQCMRPRRSCRAGSGSGRLCGGCALLGAGQHRPCYKRLQHRILGR